MRKIFKYDISVNDRVNTLKMPKLAEVVHVEVQIPQDPTTVQMWAIVEPDTELIERTFVVVGTGHDIPDNNIIYRGTAICYGGQLVWHVLELVQ